MKIGKLVSRKCVWLGRTQESRGTWAHKFLWHSRFWFWKPHCCFHGNCLLTGDDDRDDKTTQQICWEHTPVFKKMWQQFRLFYCFFFLTFFFLRFLGDLSSDRSGYWKECNRVEECLWYLGPEWSRVRFSTYVEGWIGAAICAHRTTVGGRLTGESRTPTYLSLRHPPLAPLRCREPPQGRRRVAEP